MKARSRQYSRRVCHKRGGGSGGGGASSASSPSISSGSSNKGQLIGSPNVEVSNSSLGTGISVSSKYNILEQGGATTKVAVNGSIANSANGKIFNVTSLWGADSVSDAEVNKIYKPMLKTALAEAKKAGATEAVASVSIFSGKAADFVKKAASGTKDIYGQQYYTFKL